MVKVALVGVYAAVMGVLAFLAQPATPAFTDAMGTPLEASEAHFDWVELGGVRQRLLIRGRDRANPILLVLHGGPGIPEIAQFREFNAPLEEAFLVVQWDQRGAGRSFDILADPAALTIAQMEADLDELVVLLKDRYGQRKIFLLGHSWGSFLGIRYAARHPENVAAYVGVGQVAWMIEGEDRSHDFVIAQATAANDTDVLSAMQEIGRPPYSTFSAMRQRGFVALYGGALHKPEMAPKIGGAAMSGPEMTWADYVLGTAGAWRSLDRLFPELMTINLMKEVPSLDVPVYFALGRYDHQVPADLAAVYFDRLRAPKKKLVWFENSAHNPLYEESEAFNRFMIETVRQLR
ncbi:MAG: alpha/beta fold hydrolase [Alphaproteobacteria bacterium]|nr:alpha/beta fold hydrolase [Alphaproteobacteria bacterium]